MLTVGVKLPEQDPTTKEYAHCTEVAHWPEFVALMQRLGVDLSKPYSQVVLDLDFQGGGLAKVYLAQLGADVDKAKQKQVKVDTTNPHNREWRTYQLPLPKYAPGWNLPPLTHGPLGKCFQCGVEMRGVSGPHDDLTKDDHLFCSDKCLSKYNEFKAGGG